MPPFAPETGGATASRLVLMGRIEEGLKKLCEKEPEDPRRAVIVLTTDSEGVPPEELGLEDAEPIPYQPGMYKVHMRGSTLLDLAQRPEIEEIAPDEEVRGLRDP